MTSKYFIDNSDLSNIINLNPNSNVNVNNIFLGVDLSNNALDSVTSYYFDTSSNLQNIQTNFLYQNIDIINYSYPKNYIDYTTSTSNGDSAIRDEAIRDSKNNFLFLYTYPQ